MKNWFLTGIGVSTDSSVTVSGSVVPAGVVAVSAEVLLSSLLILGLGEDAGEKSNNNQKALQNS